MLLKIILAVLNITYCENKTPGKALITEPIGLGMYMFLQHDNIECGSTFGD